MSNRLATPGYRNLRFEFNTAYSGDAWGEAMSWWFAIAELLYHAGETLPDEWQFRDSPMHAADGWMPEGYTEETLCELLDEGYCTLDDIKTFGEVINRWAGLLKAAGLDY